MQLIWHIQKLLLINLELLRRSILIRLVLGIDIHAVRFPLLLTTDLSSCTVRDFLLYFFCRLCGLASCYSCCFCDLNNIVLIISVLYDLKWKGYTLFSMYRNLAILTRLTNSIHQL